MIATARRPRARSTAPRPVARSCAAAAAVLGLALGATACGGSDDPQTGASKTPSAAPSVDLGLASGVSLTKTGSTLSFGKSATVSFEPNDSKATGLQLTVVSVAKGTIRDLAAYTLDAQTRTATPYYATVRIRNVGKTDVGKSAIPLWGLSSDDTLIGSSGFTNRFAKCPSGPLPTTFVSGQSTSTCLMYLVPQGATLKGISYRPVASDDPIVWKGALSSASPSKSPSASTSSSPSATPSQ